MKKLTKNMVSLLAFALFMSIVACANNDLPYAEDDSTVGKTATSGADSGTNTTANPFSGHNWVASSASFYGYRYSKETWSFADTTATYTQLRYDVSQSATTNVSYTYRYTYDATNNFLRLVLAGGNASFAGKSYSWTNAKEYAATWVEALATSDDATKALYTARFVQEFNTPVFYTYGIKSDKLSLSLEKGFFDGTMPSLLSFSGSGNNYDYQTGRQTYAYRVALDAGKLTMTYTPYTYSTTNKKSVAGSSLSYVAYPAFTTGGATEADTFSGDLFSYESSYDSTTYQTTTTYTKVGSFEGKYAVSGTGTSDGTVSLLFTSLPETVPFFLAKGAFSLSRTSQTFESETYTLIK